MKKIALFLILIVITAVCASEGYKVIDGDSLERGVVRIRLEGIDAPEYMQECYDDNGEQYRCGLKAMDYLQTLVSGKVRCEYLDKDRYGRHLSECYDSDGKSINAQMVESGWAMAYGSKYKEEERQARKASRGIWQGKFMRPELYRALDRAKDKHNKIKKI